MSTVEFDKRKYSTDSEYMIQNLKEKKNLEKWQKLLPGSKCICMLCRLRWDSSHSPFRQS